MKVTFDVFRLRNRVRLPFTRRRCSGGASRDLLIASNPLYGERDFLFPSDLRCFATRGLSRIYRINLDGLHATSLFCGQISLSLVYTNTTNIDPDRQQRLSQVIPTQKPPLLTYPKRQTQFETKMRSTFFVSACAILLAGSAIAQEASPVSIEREIEKRRAFPEYRW